MPLAHLPQAAHGRALHQAVGGHALGGGRERSAGDQVGQEVEGQEVEGNLRGLVCAPGVRTTVRSPGPLTPRYLQRDFCRHSQAAQPHFGQGEQLWVLGLQEEGCVGGEGQGKPASGKGVFREREGLRHMADRPAAGRLHARGGMRPISL